MKLPDIDDIVNQYDSESLDEIRTRRFDEIIQAGGPFAKEQSDEHDTINSFLERAEELDDESREIYVVDFWNTPEAIKDYHDQVASTQDIAEPVIEGGKWAERLIEAGEAMGADSAGYIVEVDSKIPEQSDLNPNQAGSPSRIFDYVRIPEEYQTDDIFTSQNEDQRLGILIDDPSIIALQGLYQLNWDIEHQNKNIDTLFRRGYKETLNNYQS